jgi:hypothetical protein
MEVEIKDILEFCPIKIELTITSEDELLDLYHRVNLNSKTVYFNLGAVSTPTVIEYPRDPNWNHLSALHRKLLIFCEKRGYRIK